MGYVADQKSQINSEFGLLMPRLRAFAQALTGCESQTKALLRATRSHFLARSAKERGHTPILIWAFMQMQKIWASRMKSKEAEQVDPRLFQPRSRMNDGGASARFAMKLAKLNAVQRGALHLVYGERLSYDEVGDIFDVQVSEIIARLAKSYAVLNESSPADRSAAYASAMPPASSRGRPMTQLSGQGQAA